MFKIKYEKLIKKSSQKDVFSASFLFYYKIRSKATVKIIGQKSIVIKRWQFRITIIKFIVEGRE